MLVNINTNSNGDAFYLFYPNLQYPYLFGTIPSGSVTAYTNGPSVPFYSDYVANCKSWRPVTMGVKFVPTVAALSSQGAMILTEVEDTPAVGVFVNSVNTSTVNLVRSIAGEPAFWVSRPTDLEYTDFKPIDNGDHVLQRTNLILAITGGNANTTVGVAELVMNIELIPKPNTIGGLFPTAPALSNPTAVNLSANVLRDMPPLHSGSQDTLGDKIKDEIASVAGAAMSAGGNALRSLVLARMGV